jgi:twitching motility protein PilT
MNELVLLIDAAKERKAHELILRAGSEPQIRIGQKLHKLEGVKGDPRWLMSILEEPEKEELMEVLVLNGMKRIEDLPFKFSMHLDMEGLGGSVSWKSENVHWGFPDLITEMLTKTQGLHLVSGVRKSGKTSAVKELLEKVLSNSNKMVALISDYDEWDYDLDSSVLKFNTQDLMSAQRVPEMADLIIFDSEDSAVAEWALRLSEQGRQVLVSWTANNLTQAFESFTDQLMLSKNSLPRDIQSRRFASQLGFAVGLKLIPGLENQFEAAYELLVTTPEIKNQLKLGNFQRTNEWMKETTEKAGSRSLNQTLLGLLLKRKVDLKAAFSVSPDPTELDAMLRKVGI